MHLRAMNLKNNYDLFKTFINNSYPEKLENPIFSSAKLIKILESTLWDDGNDIFQPTSFQISKVHINLLHCSI